MQLVILCGGLATRLRPVTIKIPKSIESNNILGKFTEAFSDNIVLDIQKNTRSYIEGGRKKGVPILQRAADFKEYETERDFPAKRLTTQLSPHLKFGTLSIREVYKAFKDQGNFSLIRQLYWRDFYYQIGFFFPHVFKGSFREKYQSLKWAYDKNLFRKWYKGETGFPIVDAGMKQLNSTGFMHNRVRMIVASFLTKDLQINWQWGEKYFAQKLIDFDIAVNNGNWQWSSSTGCDPSPYFRIFNPWTQQKKFDPECEYIKTFIPALRNLSPKDIHNLKNRRPVGIDYPKPIVNHSEARKKALLMFKNIKDI